MTDSVDLVKTDEKYVLVFDICSSTIIVRNLPEGQQERWPYLLKDIEKYLEEERKALGFEIYKFTGDGWILLFDIDFPLDKLFSFVEGVITKYAMSYHEIIANILLKCIDKIGLKFGLEMGKLFCFPMFGHTEYTGEPLIIATRLQGAIEDKDENPQDKLLMSPSVYHKVKRCIDREEHKLWQVERDLKDIGEGYIAIKYEKRLK